MTTITQEEFFGADFQPTQGQLATNEINQQTQTEEQVQTLANETDQQIDAQPVANKNMTQEEFLSGGGFSIDQPQTEEEKLNFAERFGNDIDRRVELSGEIIEAVQDGEQSYAEGVLQVAGKVGVGAILDFIGEGIISAGRGLSAITPDIIEQPLIEGATSAGRLFLETEVGKLGITAAQESANAWFEFKENNPRSARNIESVVNIGLLLAPVKGKPKVKAEPTIIGRAGEKVAQKATEQIVKNKTSFVDNLITPKQTSTVRTEQIGRTTEGGGLLRPKTVQLSPAERTISNEVANIPGVSSKNTLQGNFNIISKEVGKEADKLKSALAANDVRFPRQEYLGALDDALTRLKNNPLIVGDAEKTAEKILVKMEQIVKTKGSTGSGLLLARKELDSWIKSQKGINIFDPKQENALSIALREIRTTTNDFIANKVTSVPVKESLRKQSNLFRAMDSIAPKAADEANNALARAWQNVSRILPLRGEFNQTMATLFGMGGLGAAAAFAPAFKSLVLATGGILIGRKIILSPNTKKGISKLLKATDRAIRTTKDENLIRQLRADRVLMLELLKEGTVQVNK